MTQPASPPGAPANREARLAAKLRENLRRRKAQARALGSPGASDAAAPESPESAGALPKPDPSR